jgi:hypothetical protein
VDLVLGVSMAPKTVRIVLVEGDGAGGVTVDQDDFDVTGDAAAAASADQVIVAILGTRESAAQGGHQLLSTGVTWTDQVELAALRDALSARKIQNVMLVPPLAAAAALAQAVGSATSCDRCALLFVEPTTATLAAVDSSDGSIADVQRQPLPLDGRAVVAELAAMVTFAGSTQARREGVFLVGSGVDIPHLKSALEAATSLVITAPEEPEMALARGAALASANVRSAAPPTVAILRQSALHESSTGELAYSAVADDEDGLYGEPVADVGEKSGRKPMVAAASAVAILVGGAVALALALALGIRPHAEERPGISKNVVAPVTQPAAKPAAPAPPPPSAPPQAPAPAVQQPGPPQDAPQQEPPPRPRDRDHGWWHRRIGRGFLVP